MYLCDKCGYRSSIKIGRCPECLNWNSFFKDNDNSENIKLGKKIKKIDYDKDALKVFKLNDIEIIDINRYKTGIEEMDEILGGGIVIGSLILLGGEPGIGKTTLLVQILSYLSNSNIVLYVSAEESLSQMKMKINSLNVNTEKFYLVHEECIEKVFDIIDNIRPDVVVIDSIQTIFSQNTEGFIGSISQLKMCTALILEKAKKQNISFFIIGHVTKDGDIAGPKNLEHMVDVVLYFDGDRSSNIRFVRVIKNRFGSTGELAIFNMTNNGLIPIKDYSLHFIKNNDNNSCRILYPHIEGNKVIFVEVQALVSRTIFGYPKRTVNGIDINRLNMLLSVISKYLKINVASLDIYINVVGGIDIRDREIDLAICIALIVATSKSQIKKNFICFGEVNLKGEILQPLNTERRLKFISKLKFDYILVCNCFLKDNNKVNKLVYVDNINSVLNKINIDFDLEND